jgi:mono/diheme cytochrome c family protein
MNISRPRLGNFLFLGLATLTALSGCLTEDKPATELVNYEARHPSAQLAQARFALDSLGTLSLNGLMNANILPIKIYGTALLLMENQRPLNGERLPIVMRKFGFLTPEKIENWRADLAPEPKVKTLGFLHAELDQDVFLTHYKVEVAGITCAACHGGVTYDANGLPTGNAWLGLPNSSLNFDGFLDQIYRGLKVGMRDQTTFLAQIREAYPSMDEEEETTIRDVLFPRIMTELEKLARMDRVLPFPNGGPGLTNGIGAFKRDADLLADKYKFNPREAGYVSIPELSNRGFRSSLTIDGVYAVKGEPRYSHVDTARARNRDHISDLANLATLFTYSAMGNSIENIEPNIGHVQDIFTWLKDVKPPHFPAPVDVNLAAQGAVIYSSKCASCHGSYENGADNRPVLTSFPNRFVSQAQLGTDRQRWFNVTGDIREFADKNVFGIYADAGAQLGGYVAPILSGLWATAPYLHNGSVPTLWHLMHPESRPTRFEHGGHALDFAKVGIRGALNTQGEYVFETGYVPWAGKQLYDTRAVGRSNKGHERPFTSMNEDDKAAVTEYLKLL